MHTCSFFLIGFNGIVIYSDFAALYSQHHMQCLFLKRHGNPAALFCPAYLFKPMHLYIPLRVKSLNQRMQIVLIIFFICIYLNHSILFHFIAAIQKHTNPCYLSAARIVFHFVCNCCLFIMSRIELRIRRQSKDSLLYGIYQCSG